MRNYIGISEFKTNKNIYNLESFDDEFFIILRNNSPVYIAFPNIIEEDFIKKFFFHSECVSVRDFIKKGIDIQPNTVLHLLKDNSQYYNLILFGREEAVFIEEILIKKIRAEHLIILKNN